MFKRTLFSVLFPAVILIGFTSLCWSTVPSAGAAKQSEAAVVRPSKIIEYLRDRLTNEPKIDPGDLAAIGNKLIEQKGLDYDFDACEILDRNPGKAESIVFDRETTWNYPATFTGGKKIDLKIIIMEEPGSGGLCGECFFPLPSLRVTGRELLIVPDGAPYRLKRPASFHLGEASLMDAKMKKKLRTWQLPYQFGPEGISPDGTKLYYAIHYYDSLSSILILELSDDGTARFKVKKDLDLSDEGELIVDYPKAQNIGDLTFVRFRVAGKSYIVRFDSPCT